MWELSDFTEVRRWYALHAIIFTTFFVASVFINIIQMVLYVILRPLSKSIYRKINYYLLYSIMAQILFLAEWWSLSEVRVHADPANRALWGKEHCLIIMNHTYEVDWLMGWMVADYADVLGAAKVFIKKVIQYVPTFGWAWRCSDVIFLSRNWQEDKEVMETQVREFNDYPYPVWMLLFAEGTRFTPAKHEASMKFATERGLVPLKRHLIPRTRGFTLCAQTLQGHFPAIYDVTVAFNTKEGAEPTLLSMLRGHKVLSEIYIRRLPLADVPTHDEKKSAAYLQKLYEEKDQLLDSHCLTGSFTQNNDMESFEPYLLPRRYYSLFNMLGWMVVVMCLMVKLFFMASVYVQYFIGLIFFLAFFGMSRMIGLTKIDKGSKYGNSPAAKTSSPATDAGASPIKTD